MRLHSLHTKVCSRRLTTKDPWRGSRVSSCIMFKWSHATNESQKDNKSQNLPRRKHISKGILNKISLNKIAQNLFSVCGLKSKYLSQKRTLWIEEPELNFRKKAIKEESKGKKSRSIKRMKNGMGMRNKRIYLFTICYNRVVSELEAIWR